ncbi:hypothetical protein EVAR_41789_1 [Eumeta japonica]|uniref:Uncharacterized protein n=1 Tax=Eumeta variegata TaxID=151549 RepID=A0A4C1W054_EUMVA|nr:hypothetical protein EVAR_41789_1 [Eumeta japonica]
MARNPRGYRNKNVINRHEFLPNENVTGARARRPGPARPARPAGEISPRAPLSNRYNFYKNKIVNYARRWAGPNQISFEVQLLPKVFNGRETRPRSENSPLVRPSRTPGVTSWSLRKEKSPYASRLHSSFPKCFCGVDTPSLDEVGFLSVTLKYLARNIRKKKNENIEREVDRRRKQTAAKVPRPQTESGRRKWRQTSARRGVDLDVLAHPDYGDEAMSVIPIRISERGEIKS